MEGTAQNFTAILAAGGTLFLLCLALVVWLYQRKRQRAPKPFDLLEGHEFEYYCADLLKRKGFLEVEVTRGSGDYGADILAEKDGVTYAIQCKCYTDSVGVKAVQEAHA